MNGNNRRHVVHLGITTRNLRLNAIRNRIRLTKLSSTVNLLRILLKHVSGIHVTINDTTLRRRDFMILAINTIYHNRFRRNAGNTILNRLTCLPSKAIVMSKGTIYTNMINIQIYKRTTISRRHWGGMDGSTRDGGSTRDNRGLKNTTLNENIIISII